MKRAFIHIGYGKTGTSSLQSFLEQNSKTFYNLGYYYPNLENSSSFGKNIVGSGNAALLARSLLPKDHFFYHNPNFDVFSRLDNLVSAESIRDIILSSEFLCMLDCNKIQQISNIFDQHGYETYIIIYIRRQDKMAFSAYGQGFIAGHSTWSKEFHEEVYNVSKRFNYYQYLLPLISLYGKDRILLRVYDKHALIGSDIRNDFLDCINHSSSPDAFLFSQKINISMPHINIYIMYLLLRMGHKINDIKPLFSKTNPHQPTDTPYHIKEYFESINELINKFHEPSNRMLAYELYEEERNIFD